MIDKNAAKLEALVEEDAKRIGLKEIPKNDHANSNRIKLAPLDECTLVLQIHRDQTHEVLSCLQSRGIEAFPSEETDSSFGEYDTVYIPTMHPETDIIRYQKVLDEAD